MVQPDESANAIIAQALKNAGVPPRNIELPPGTEAEPAEKLPSLDGEPKGQVKEVPGEAEATELPQPGAEKPSELPKPGEPIVQPLGKAEIEAAITEATSKFQSMIDRKINQIDYQMKQTITALNQFFQTQEDSSIAGLPEGEQITRRLERLEQGTGAKIRIDTKQSIEAQPVQFYQQLVNFVDTVGLKIDDKRIDWAPGVEDQTTGFNRFLVSVKAALVEDQTKVLKELRDNGGKAILQLRKKAGIDKVSVTGPSGEGTPDLSKMTPLEKINYGFELQEQLAQASQ